MKNIVECIYVKAASCLGNRGIKILYTGYSRIYNVVGASCPCNKRIRYFIQDIVEYIYVAGAVYLGNRGINYGKYTSSKWL